jgi:hypothetical protein
MSDDEYTKNVAVDTQQLLRDADEEVSALTGGVAKQTVSLRVALADARGERWACWFCWFLSHFVQHDHCRITRDNGPMDWTVYVRALVCFLFCLVGVPWMILAPSWTLTIAWFWLMAVDFTWGLYIDLERN